jgi:Glycosyl transferase family 2
MRALRLPPDRAAQRRAEGGLRLQGLAAKATPLERSGLKAPLVSYLTVVRNAEKTLERTFRSVRAQRWPHVEHIVLDGASTDGTLALIEAHAAHIDYYASEPDGGLYEALNKAINLARGDLICVLNADDWLTADAAELAVRAHQAAGSPERHLVLSSAWIMKAKGQRLWLPGPLDLGAYLRCANVCHNGVYATPEAYRASGPYATDLRVAADFKWLMACVDAGVRTTAIAEPTVHYSLGGVSSDLQRHTQNCAQILAQRFAFLSEAQVWGLLHAFHSFRGNLEPFAATRPAQLQTWVDALANEFSQQADFVQALQQAQEFTRWGADGQPAAGRRQTPVEKLRRGALKLRMHARALLLPR